MTQQTLYEKLWDRHVVDTLPGGEALLYIDRHLIHEVSSPQAFASLREKQRPAWRPDANMAVPDHAVPTRNRELGVPGIRDGLARQQVRRLEDNCRDLRIPLINLTDQRQGIVHVVGPEQGLTLPGITLVCGDSHTSTHGALATLSMGIGTSEVEHVLATQTLRTRKLKTLRVLFHGELDEGVTAKDMVLAMIGRLGTAGATGYAIEYAGETVEQLSVEARMTLCNMSIEAGARAGLVAYDAVTEAYVRDRPGAPDGAEWDQATAHWRGLVSDPRARFDREEVFDAGALEPQVTWGTSPEMVVPVTGQTPDPRTLPAGARGELERALAYMGLTPGQPLEGLPIDRVFIGSCTNARIEDLRQVASLVRGHRLSPRIKQAIIVPGSGLVRLQAEREGLADIFECAGFEWRAAGCSMCLGMNDDRLAPGERCASTSNRNFEGRQGKGGRTHLMSPAMAAAAALAGVITDVRGL
ncbi:3-isopropylmalate dehydratase large subunit [Alloalcanivorax gelatiniphagus]|uniref:3-isopropylmalate dehydratase large subunit n=1 Tax=Alloalcanivorax gelatiniphagus TaxID=1194167 RepID=A0ABY2XG82_9GAMM|nr:3-isopropylmalate dehydratase large subunit [Alloalcanivorax gelatiniphagus]TMW10614.1 3-isopropylmalate dehydratase large subunit [Alloalcanivorax gelatiniphagus]